MLKVVDVARSLGILAMSKTHSGRSTGLRPVGCSKLLPRGLIVCCRELGAALAAALELGVFVGLH
jgi:hypothetical protein